MKNCGKRFHNEVGKFRFLNELIKVVSPKVSLELFCVDFSFQMLDFSDHSEYLSSVVQLVTGIDVACVSYWSVLCYSTWAHELQNP